MCAQKEEDTFTVCTCVVAYNASGTSGYDSEYSTAIFEWTRCNRNIKILVAMVAISANDQDHTASKNTACRSNRVRRGDGVAGNGVNSRSFSRSREPVGLAADGGVSSRYSAATPAIGSFKCARSIRLLTKALADLRLGSV